MAYTVEYTDEFGAIWAGFSESQQEEVAAMVGLMEGRGPNLPFPTVRESPDRAIRICASCACSRAGERSGFFYAFDPRRAAILLIGGDKTGDDRFYQWMIPVADALYDTHLAELKQEGLLP